MITSNPPSLLPRYFAELKHGDCFNKTQTSSIITNIKSATSEDEWRQLDIVTYNHHITQPNLSCSLSIPKTLEI